jgi:hypothetical protein
MVAKQSSRSIDVLALVGFRRVSKYDIVETRLFVDYVRFLLDAIGPTIEWNFNQKRQKETSAEAEKVTFRI